MERKAITVTALNKYLKFRLDQDANLQNIFLRAEISNFKPHSRGHFYFTLKDEESQIAAVMFANNAKSVLFDPKNGTKVLVEGYVSVYEVAGTYQLYVTKMTLDGIGDLYLAYEKLKKKLEEKGMFAAAHKKSLPAFPKTVGVITSPTGAAVRDVIHIINRRFPLTSILIYPALVQGEEAKNSIVKMIEKANADAIADVLIVGRGGGSIEDLWAFNEEIVANAIYQSRIPIVSAVGHETDFTIADFVADLRAPTPSGAAELVVPDSEKLRQDLDKLKQKLDYVENNRLRTAKKSLQTVLQSAVFRNPDRLLEKSRMQVLNISDRLEQTDPAKVLLKKSEQISQFSQRLDRGFHRIYLQNAHLFTLMAEKLELLNPLAIMKKGYAVVKKNQKIIRSVQEIAPQDMIDVVLQDGTADCIVTGIRKEA
jgi:exodeoxyribonuclease VII large subunit